MKRAGLYAFNRGAVVVVDDAVSPPTVVAWESFVTMDADPGTIVRWAMSHGAEQILLTEPEGFPAHAITLAAAISEASPAAGVPALTVDEPGRRAQRGAAAKLFPRGAGPEAVRDALALVLATMVPAPVAPKVSPGVAEVSAELMRVIAGPDAPDPDWALHHPKGTQGAAVAEARTDVYEVPTHPPVIEVAPVEPAVLLPRFAGIDPGERWIAVEVAEGPACPLRHVASLVVEIPLKPTDDDLDDAVGEVLVFCEDHGVERAAVERALNVHRGTKEGAALGGLSTRLLRGQYVAGILRGALRAAHHYDASGALVRSVPHVESVSSVKWRNLARRLAGRPCKKEEPWEPAVRAAIAGLPDHPGEHVLDAAGACVWAATPEEKRGPAPKRKAGPAVPRAPGKPHQGGHAARDAKRAAAREAAGCTCVGARHYSPCPIWREANEKRKQKMAGNKNAAKGEAPS